MSANLPASVGKNVCDVKPKPQPMIRIRLGLATGVFAWPIDSNNGNVKTVDPTLRNARRL